MSTVFVYMCSYFVRDLDRVFNFYGGLFEWPEMVETRTESFRGLFAPNGLRVGFHGPEAYELLDVQEPSCRPHNAPSILTVEVDNEERVNELSALAERLGGRVVKAPYRTFYDVWQVVLADPEENLVRLNYRYSASEPSPH